MPARTETITDTIPETVADAWTEITAAMPATPRDAAYTALGLPVLVLDEVRTRLAPARKAADEQLNIARKHAGEATRDWQNLITSFGRPAVEAPAKKAPAKTKTTKKASAKSTKSASKKAKAKKK